MALRFYLVPEEITVQGDGIPRRAPKFVDGVIARWYAMDYGNEPVMLVAADVTGAQHTVLAAQVGVAAFPADLSQTIGGALTAVQDELEIRKIPADAVTASMTYRTLLRWVARLFQLSQVHQGLFPGRLIPAGLTLNSLVSDLTVTQRQRWTTAAGRLGLSTAGISLGMTLRQALKYLGDQITLTIKLGDL